MAWSISRNISRTCMHALWNSIIVYRILNKVKMFHNLWENFDKAMLEYKSKHPKLNTVVDIASSAEESCIRVRERNESESAFVELGETKIVEPAKRKRSNASEYPPGYIPPQDNDISTLSVYTGSRINRLCEGMAEALERRSRSSHWVACSVVAAQNDSEDDCRRNFWCPCSHVAWNWSLFWAVRFCDS